MAVKVIPKNRLLGVVGEPLLRREFEIGRRVAESGGDMLLAVIDVGDTDEELFLVMRRAEKALSDIATPLDESAVAPVITDIASGLQQLHSIGIIHRDLKPANVLRHMDLWKLADFGIARDQEIGTQDLTFIGWGSHAYMAPEIWELKSPTIKTDLYALGCLAYELLAGSLPYPGDRETARAGHLMGPSPEVPARNIVLKRLIAGLIAKDPGNRPQDAREVLERLRTTRSSLSVEERNIAVLLAEKEAANERLHATLASEKAVTEIRSQLVTQARIKLRDIIQGALERLEAIGPGASFEELGARKQVRLAYFRRKAGRGQFARVNEFEYKPAAQIAPSFFLSAGPATLAIYFSANDVLPSVAAEYQKVAWGRVSISTWPETKPIRVVMEGDTYTNLKPPNEEDMEWNWDSSGRDLCHLSYEMKNGRHVWIASKGESTPQLRQNQSNSAGRSKGSPASDGTEFTVNMLLALVEEALRSL
jgi:hypothetical protein